MYNVFPCSILSSPGEPSIVSIELRLGQFVLATLDRSYKNHLAMNSMALTTPVVAPRLPRLPGRGVDRNLGSSRKPVSRQHSGNSVCNPCASCITFAGFNL
jgi:hypothetical protein